MGLSRNKVAVPEGAAGTPPFWSGSPSSVLTVQGDFFPFALLILFFAVCMMRYLWGFFPAAGIPFGSLRMPVL